MADIRKLLRDTLDKKRRDKMVSDMASNMPHEEITNKAVEQISQSLIPVLEKLLEKDRLTAEQITTAIKSLKIEAPHIPEIKSPSVQMPEIRVPQPRVTVTVPDVKIPEIKMPTEMQTRGWLNLIGYGQDLLNNPIPVQLRDATGNPINLSERISQVLSGGGGKADFFTIKGFSQSAFAEITNPDGRVKVELPTGSSGLTDTELRASAVPVSQLSGASWSVSASLETTASLFNADNRLRVSVETGGSGLTDAELRASSVPVAQASGASWSTSASIVSVSDIFSTTATSSVVNTDNRVKVELPATTVTVGSITASTATVNLDRDGNPQSAWQVYPVATGLNETNANILRVVQMTDSNSSVNVTTFNGNAPATGLNETTSGVLRTVLMSDSIYSVQVSSQPSTFDVKQVSGSIDSVSVTNTVTVTGSLTSAVVVGPTVADAADDGNAPVQMGGIARQANPTAVSANDVVKATMDDLGRQITRPYQVRDLTLTAYVSLTNGTETTLLAASAGSFHDLVWILAANTSSAAQTIDIREVTAGNIVMSLYIPANSTAGIAPALPWPQSSTGNNWTVDNADVTNSTVNVSALFVREV